MLPRANAFPGTAKRARLSLTLPGRVSREEHSRTPQEIFRRELVFLTVPRTAQSIVLYLRWNIGSCSVKWINTTTDVDRVRMPCGTQGRNLFAWKLLKEEEG